MPTPLDDRLTTIQKESETLWQQLGQKEYVKRVLEAEMAQLCQRILQLNQEADVLKKATAMSLADALSSTPTSASSG